jgi:hypothetical protein
MRSGRVLELDTMEAAALMQHLDDMRVMWPAMTAEARLRQLKRAG